MSANQNQVKSSMDIEKEIMSELLKRFEEDSSYEFAISYDRGFDTDDMVYTRKADEALQHVQAADIEYVMVRRPGDELAFAWVMFVYGNGEDVITDYTTSMEPYVGQVLDAR